MEFFKNLSMVTGLIGLAIILAIIAFIKLYQKVEQGKALIRNGFGGTRVSFGGMLIIPIMHRAEVMNISVKRIQIERMGKDGLICNDNMRADIKVAFFVRVNKTETDVKRVAEALGVARASDLQGMTDLFDAKFSEALKTVGKNFDFVDLYKARAKFKSDIIEIIGTDLNGFVLDDCAIDFLEQTELTNLSADNILDSEGIKKITELTATQKLSANQIDREREKAIKQQNVDAEEAVLEMDRHLAEAQERQKREVSSIKARETAETHKIQQAERLKSEQARIQTEEELSVAEQNKQRQIIVAEKNKQRTEAIEGERIRKDQMLEQTERERVVALAGIEKERALEVERKNIQDVIRERVVVEKTVVEEQEKIKDTQAIAEGERTKKVALLAAQQISEEAMMKEVKAAESKKEVAVLEAQQRIVEADAAQKTADKSAEARKLMAQAQAAEEAALGLAEVQVQEARAKAREMEGEAEASAQENLAKAEANGKQAFSLALIKEGEAKASVMSNLAIAEARAIEVKAEARKKEGQIETERLEARALAEARSKQAHAAALATLGEAEANNMLKKFQADAKGIAEKAQAMKLFDEAGRSHEEFKLDLDKQETLALADIQIRKDIAQAQSLVLSEGLKAANIDIVGGDTMFFEKILGAVTQGKQVDRLVAGSQVLTDVKDTLFNGDPDYFKSQLKRFIEQFGFTSEDIKNLSLSAAVSKMFSGAKDDKTRGVLQSILDWSKKAGLNDTTIKDLVD